MSFILWILEGNTKDFLFWKIDNKFIESGDLNWHFYQMFTVLKVAPLIIVIRITLSTDT